jgi:hypothetical protein
VEEKHEQIFKDLQETINQVNVCLMDGSEENGNSIENLFNNIIVKTSQTLGMIWTSMFVKLK